MKIPLEITVRGIDHSDAVEAKIRQRARVLERFSHRIQRCEVWVEAPHGHHRKGRLYNIHIRLTVPNDELSVKLQPNEDDIYVAIRDSFDALRRQLEDAERRANHRSGHLETRRPARARSRTAAKARPEPEPDSELTAVPPPLREPG